MNAVNTLPTSAQMIPAVTPPSSAAENFTRVFGSSQYRKVNTTVTIA